MINKSIYITGSCRSGSTFLARMLTIGKDIQYIHEPFNPAKGKNDWFIKNFYTYINKNTNPSVSNEFVDFVRSLRDDHERYVLKDLNIFAVEALAELLDLQVIVSMRHPASTIASFKIREWNHRIKDLLVQDELMDTVLVDFKKEIEGVKTHFDAGIVIWNLTSYYLHSLVIKHNYIVVRNEDLSLDPLGEFGGLYELFGLDFTSKVKRKILLNCNSDHSHNKYSIVRDSKLNIFAYKNRLTQDEIAEIKNRTKDYWFDFYNENDWF